MRRGDSKGMGGIDHSICPSAPVPATVLVVVMSDGGYLLVGYPQGEPSAFVISEDAVPLRHALATAFGSDLMRGKATRP
ncbi:MAG: hypothetical protein ACRDRM_06845 [Pseudonocardiaceae bacterium]